MAPACANSPTVKLTSIRCARPDAKTVFYVDTTAQRYMKVPIDGGKPEPVLNVLAETTRRDGYCP